METRATVYNLQGIAIAQLDAVSIRRSWILNDVSVALFDIARTDPNCRADVLRIGNYLVIEHDRAGVWGGVIWSKPTGQMWYADKVSVSAQSMGSIFYRRRGSPAAIYEAMQPGAIFAGLIANMNDQSDTRIVEGDISQGGGAINMKAAEVMLNVPIKKLVEKTGQDYDITPETQNGLLVFKANWYERQGVKHNYMLEEGKNIKLDLSPIMTIVGDIKNNVLAKGMRDAKIREVDSNLESIAEYGLSQSVSYADSPAGARKTIDAELLKYRNPRKIYKLTAIDVDSAFSYLGLGDRVMLRLPSVDFEGTYTTVRVMAREFDDATGELVLTLDEYLEVE